VIVDPSHAVGIRDKVSSAGLAAIAAGADGLTVEVHPRPDEALSDGPQSLYPEQFEKLMRDIEALAPVVGKELLRTPKPHHARHGADTPSASSSSSAASATIFETLPVAFAGESGAYAEQALMRAFGDDAKRKQTNSFKEVFDAVLDGSACAGVIPVENSLAGSIHENYDLFLRYPDIAMVGELTLRIVHCLIADERTNIDAIKIIRSHPQAFAQCKEFLDKYPDWTLEPCNNTAVAVASIAREGAMKVAAIASESAARANGLKILKEGIETNPLNYTRFAIISRRVGDVSQTEAASQQAASQQAASQQAASQQAAAPVPPSLGTERANKASLVFSVSDEPGSLFACLQIMSGRGINLSKLESRPIQGKPWEYLFYIDVSIPEASAVFDDAIVELKKKTKDFHFLGNYRAVI
jgi:3-deoxy-7-phosphoheptulonate synthase